MGRWWWFFSRCCRKWGTFLSELKNCLRQLRLSPHSPHWSPITIHDWTLRQSWKAWLCISFSTLGLDFASVVISLIFPSAHLQAAFIYLSCIVKNTVYNHVQSYISGKSSLYLLSTRRWPSVQDLPRLHCFLLAHVPQVHLVWPCINKRKQVKFLLDTWRHCDICGIFCCRDLQARDRSASYYFVRTPGLTEIALHHSRIHSFIEELSSSDATNPISSTRKPLGCQNEIPLSSPTNLTQSGISSANASPHHFAKTTLMGLHQ